MGEPYHAEIRGSSGGSLMGKLRCVKRLGDLVDPSSSGFGLHAGVEATSHLQVVTIPTTRGGLCQLQFLGGRLVWSWAISSDTPSTRRPSTRPWGHGGDSLGHRQDLLPAQHPLGLATRGPSCLAYSSRPTSAVGDGS